MRCPNRGGRNGLISRGAPGPGPQACLSLPTPLHRGGRLAVELAAPDGLALVIPGLALGEREFHLDPVPLQPDGDRDDSEPLFGHLRRKARDVAPVEEQLAAADRVMVCVPCIRVRRDVDVCEKRLAPLESDPAVLQLDVPLPDRFHLAAGESDPCREPLEELVLEAGATVGNQHLHARTTSARMGIRSGSNCLPASARITSSAASRLAGRRYEEGDVRTSYTSAMWMMRLGSGTFRPARRCG